VPAKPSSLHAPRKDDTIDEVAVGSAKSEEGIELSLSHKAGRCFGKPSLCVDIAAPCTGMPESPSTSSDTTKKESDDKSVRSSSSSNRAEGDEDYMKDP
jgi:hypothetical protein